jgi:hypothetical protein
MAADEESSGALIHLRCVRADDLATSRPKRSADCDTEGPVSFGDDGPGRCSSKPADHSTLLF